MPLPTLAGHVPLQAAGIRRGRFFLPCGRDGRGSAASTLHPRRIEVGQQEAHLAGGMGPRAECLPGRHQDRPGVLPEVLGIRRSCQDQTITDPDRHRVRPAPLTYPSPPRPLDKTFSLHSRDPEHRLTLPPCPPGVMTGVTFHLGSEGPRAIELVLHHVVVIFTHFAIPIPSSVILFRDEHPMLACLGWCSHGPLSTWK